ncbi:hypothetical protein AMTRI_Chr01g113340 [Amborella trichopoda]
MDHWGVLLCIFFSCKFGERCKNLHPRPQQSMPNPFGQQQSRSNPFGFGVQNTSQSKVAFGGFQIPDKPLPQNKWNRFSPVANGNPKPSTARQTESQQKALSTQSRRPTDSLQKTHGSTCTDPEICKKQIIENSMEEPLWKLTCYGHWNYLPCDITGDISFEELRAAAYDDARRGVPLQSIVERERNLLQAKLLEFENLRRNPYVIPRKSSSFVPLPSPATNPNISPPGFQQNMPPSVSSFSQLGMSTSTGLNTRQQSSFQVSSQTSGSSNSAFGAPPKDAFGQQGPFQISNQTSPGFGTSNSAFGTPGLFGNKVPNQPFGSSAATMSNSQIPTSPSFPMFTNNYSPGLFGGPNVGFNPGGSGVNTSNISLADDKQVRLAPGEPDIWSKEEWEVGEIPEDEPPSYALL